MTLPIDRILDALHEFERGVFQLNGPVSQSDINALNTRLPRELPVIWSSLLMHHDGLDLRGDRYFGAAECLARWVRWQRDELPRYEKQPGWRGPPPTQLVPIATDLEGNLKCLDLYTDQVWDWHGETGRLTLWFTSLEHLVLCALQSLSLRFDAAGRPKAMSSRRHSVLVRDELLIHVQFEPDCPYAQLELGRWFEQYGTPENAVACFRRAAHASVHTMEAAFELGRFCTTQKWYAEARRALRHALAVPPAPNPLEHQPPTGMHYAAHRLLERLYVQIGQLALADTQKQAADKALKEHGLGWYGHSDAFNQALDILK